MVLQHLCRAEQLTITASYVRSEGVRSVSRCYEHNFSQTRASQFDVGETPELMQIFHLYHFGETHEHRDDSDKP